MWSGPSAPSSRPQGADYYSSSSQNSMKGGGGSVRFDNRMDTTGYPLPQENLPPVEENKEEMVEEILELEGYSDGGDDEAGDYVDFGNNIKVPTVSDSFEGINFPQLFAASNDHSEKIIDLARQFYCVSFTQFSLLFEWRVIICVIFIYLFVFLEIWRTSRGRRTSRWWTTR